MKRKFIALGIVSPLMLAMCLFAFLVTGLVGWLILKPDTAPDVVRRIVRMGPLPPVIAPAAPETNEAAPNPNPAAESQPLPAAEPQQDAASSPEGAEIPTPTPDVAATLGFALPPDTVNSVTQAGVANRVVIPKLGLDAPVLLSPIKNQTWKVDHLGQAVGHLEGTAPPGSNSNIVLAGHVTLAAGVYGPFAGLAQLATGDLILIYEGDKKYQYVVDGYQTVARTAIEVTHPTDTGQITLITCSNWNRDAERYEQRIVVKGHLLAE